METQDKQAGFWARFRENSKNNYRMVVMNADTFDEVRAFNLTPMNIYVAVSSVLLLLSILIFLLIAYTPLRKYIPGYGDVVQRQELMAMEDTVEALTEKLDAQTAYIENFRRILVGDDKTFEDLEKRNDSIAIDDIPAPTLSEEEIRLRREIELERVGQVARSGGPSNLPTAGSQEVPLEQTYLVAPVNGEVSAGFNPQEDHLGVDILAPQNTAIKSAAAGIVFMSEFTSANGNVIGIQHENDLITFYKHNSELLKAVGDRVNSGEAVAIIGNTGILTTGPHLHFEIWHRGRAVDPANYLSF